MKAMIVLIGFKRSECSETCDTLSVDAITGLNNNTIAIFDRSDVWLLNRGSDLSGPCPVNTTFPGMSGPVEAAVTILDHQSIVEFIGAGVYFANKQFFTFKNLKPYVVEWGSLKYLPHKGLQQMMAASAAHAQDIIKSSPVMAAYYDPTDSRTKVVFRDRKSVV